MTVRGETMDLKEMAAEAVTEIAAAIDLALPGQINAMSEPIQRSRRIALYGVGREGLMIKTLAMRLFHLGLDAHLVGDMTTPPLATGDLLIVSAGPGHFSTCRALIEVSRAAGAETLCVTAEPQGRTAQEADHLIHLPAQTMARDSGNKVSVLPMGSLYEGVMFLFFEILILDLQKQLGLSAQAMRANHTNLE